MQPEQWQRSIKVLEKNGRANSRKIKPLEIALLLAAILIAYKLIVYVAQLLEAIRLPPGM